MDRETIRRNFAASLADLLEKRGLSQQRAADIAGVDQTQIWYWLHAQRVPQTYTIVRLAKALGVTTDYLLGVTGDE
jgi:transcriptional regulator with XRE-family HTH domain